MSKIELNNSDLEARVPRVTSNHANRNLSKSKTSKKNQKGISGGATLSRPASFVVVVTLLLSLIVPVGIITYVGNSLAPVDNYVGEYSDVEDPTRVQLGTSERLYIDIPAGWDIARIDAVPHYLSADEMDAISPRLTGSWPIFTLWNITLEKNGSFFIMESSGWFMPSGGDYYPSPFDPLMDGAIVLKEPTNDSSSFELDKYGIARVNIEGYEGQRYEYHLYYNVPDNHEEPSSGDYLSTFNNPGGPQFVYDGSAAYLEVADAMFMEFCVENSTGWCN